MVCVCVCVRERKGESGWYNRKKERWRDMKILLRISIRYCRKIQIFVTSFTDQLCLGIFITKLKKNWKNIIIDDSNRSNNKL